MCFEKVLEKGIPMIFFFTDIALIYMCESIRDCFIKYFFKEVCRDH